MTDDEFGEYEEEETYSISDYSDVSVHLPDYSDIVRSVLVGEQNNIPDLRITYSFPSDVRNNRAPKGTYGGKGVTFKHLYTILCNRFNDGKSFIDDYLETVYPHTVKEEVEANLANLHSRIDEVYAQVFEGVVYTKKKRPDRRYKVNRNYAQRVEEYNQFRERFESDSGEDIARTIKDDIIKCMQNGQLQLECISHTNTLATQVKRLHAGLSDKPVFLATEQLIQSLQIHVKLGA